MKKLIALFTAALALLSLTACSHRHSVGTWSIDPYSHWHVCTECGDEISRTEHEFRSNGICVVCNAEVTSHGDGSFTVTVYDSEGNEAEKLRFDEDGNRQ
ncbi:MAG: hypothetical protein IJW21_00530 [Clostridia bacterium]|nr:hypothetical protein [Clostridia bacterium]